MILKSGKMLKKPSNNRLKKHVKQNCHYNYLSIYSMSLLFLFIIWTIKTQIIKIKHRIEHENLHKNCLKASTAQPF